MSLDEAKHWLDRQPGEGSVAYIQPDDLKRVLEIVYADLGGLASLRNYQGVLTGTGTPMPSSPAVGDLWQVRSPIPTAAPAGTGDRDVIMWTGSGWMNLGGVEGPTGPQGPPGDPVQINWNTGVKTDADRLALQNVPEGTMCLVRDTGVAWIYSRGQWVAMGSLMGPPGPTPDADTLGYQRMHRNMPAVDTTGLSKADAVAWLKASGIPDGIALWDDGITMRDGVTTVSSWQWDPAGWQGFLIWEFNDHVGTWVSPRGLYEFSPAAPGGQFSKTTQVTDVGTWLNANGDKTEPNQATLNVMSPVQHPAAPIAEFFQHDVTADPDLLTGKLRARVTAAGEVHGTDGTSDTMSRMVPLHELKTLVAASASWNDFQTAVAGL